MGLLDRISHEVLGANFFHPPSANFKIHGQKPMPDLLKGVTNGLGKTPFYRGSVSDFSTQSPPEKYTDGNIYKPLPPEPPRDGLGLRLDVMI